MQTNPLNPKRLFQRSERFSPLDLVQCAAVFSLLFLVLHLAGLREFTGILSGTVGSLALGWRLSAALAAIYIFVYLAFVVLVPILVLAALMLVGMDKVMRDSVCLRRRHIEDARQEPRAGGNRGNTLES